MRSHFYSTAFIHMKREIKDYDNVCELFLYFTLYACVPLKKVMITKGLKEGLTPLLQEE